MVIGSDTAPVREVLNDTNGLLVPFLRSTNLQIALLRFSLILIGFALFVFKHDRQFLISTT